MDLPELLETSRIACHSDIQSKKRALQTVAELLGADIENEELSDMDILDALIGRERLGSTALGHGVALPHSRLPDIDAPIAALLTLSDGVDYDAADGEPVDIVIGLLVPEDSTDEHLQILAQLARRFNDSELRDRLRSFTSSSELLEHLRQTAPAD